MQLNFKDVVIKALHWLGTITQSPSLNFVFLSGIMASYTTLVHIDEAAASKIASFVAKLEPNGAEAFESEAKALISKQNTLAFIDMLLQKEALIFALERDNGKSVDRVSILLSDLKNYPLHF